MPCHVCIHSNISLPDLNVSWFLSNTDILSNALLGQVTFLKMPLLEFHVFYAPFGHACSKMPHVIYMFSTALSGVHILIMPCLTYIFSTALCEILGQYCMVRCTYPIMPCPTCIFNTGLIERCLVQHMYPVLL